MNLKTKFLAIQIGAIVVSASALPACKKFLDEKSDKRLLVPTKVEDLQPLLDEYIQVNYNEPYYPGTSSDDFYVPGSNWNNVSQVEQSMHTWQLTGLFPPGQHDWILSYNNVYRANVVLNEATSLTVTPENKTAYDNLLGHAYFLRAKSFLQVAWIWCNAYDAATADQDLGIPLRLDPDFNLPSFRSTVRETYWQIVNDAQQAVAYLPKTAVHVMRPSLTAAYALLARVYLSMRMYDSCLKYSTLSLDIKSDLMDYNGDDDVDPGSAYPFRQFNKEVIYENFFPYPSAIYFGVIDSTLLQMYQEGDLRKQLFFPSATIGIWSGNYCNNQSLFSGLATDEVLLMRSESNARVGNVQEALTDLNMLMIKRWKSGEFVAFAESDREVLIDHILDERRKELVFRGLRWMDIKRLNKEGRNIRLKRKINGQSFELEPNAERYAAPIPNDVIDRSDIEQNPQ